jgi:hypothetical protein
MVVLGAKERTEEEYRLPSVRLELTQVLGWWQPHNSSSPSFATSTVFRLWECIGLGVSLGWE